MRVWGCYSLMCVELMLTSVAVVASVERSLYVCALSREHVPAGGRGHTHVLSQWPESLCPLAGHWGGAAVRGAVLVARGSRVSSTLQPGV